MNQAECDKQFRMIAKFNHFEDIAIAIASEDRRFRRRTKSLLVCVGTPAYEWISQNWDQKNADILAAEYDLGEDEARMAVAACRLRVGMELDDGH